MASTPYVAAESVGSRTLQKIRMRILPFILVLYIILFLDRINIGFAALTMNQELGITSQQFGILVRQLYLPRFLLGIAEAGYYPGILLYLTSS
jgi:MFS transporter, ACS family, tartrate transporter